MPFIGLSGPLLLGALPRGGPERHGPAVGGARAGRPSRAALWVLYADTFTMAVGFYMLVPLLAFHLLDSVGLSIALIGVLTADRAAQNGLMPIAGWIADRIDYRRAISSECSSGPPASRCSAPREARPHRGIGPGRPRWRPLPPGQLCGVRGARGRAGSRIYATREVVSNVGFVVGPLVGGVLAGLDFAFVSWAPRDCSCGPSSSPWWGSPADCRARGRTASGPSSPTARSCATAGSPAGCGSW